eukprot:COSAG01_NODE_13270_length_1609_cov_1.515894_1_plen_50_part_10
MRRIRCRRRNQPAAARSYMLSCLHMMAAAWWLRLDGPRPPRRIGMLMLHV